MVRGVTELSGLREIRSMTSSKKRSIPRVQSSTYLDLYMLKKEKDRIEKEVYVLDKRKNSLQKRLTGIDAEMKKLEKKETGEQTGVHSDASPRHDASERAERERQMNIVAFKKHPAKDWKTMAIKY